MSTACVTVASPWCPLAELERRRDCLRFDVLLLFARFNNDERSVVAPWLSLFVNVGDCENSWARGAQMPF